MRAAVPTSAFSPSADSNRTLARQRSSNRYSPRQRVDNTRSSRAKRNKRRTLVKSVALGIALILGLWILQALFLLHTHHAATAGLSTLGKLGSHIQRLRAQGSIPRNKNNNNVDKTPGAHARSHAFRHQGFEKVGNQMASKEDAAKNEAAMVESVAKLKAASFHVFYYTWYGTPKDDGAWRHWDHEYMPHWTKEETAKWPTGRHVPPDDIGSSYYPALGPYSSSTDATLNQHFSDIALKAGISTVVISWYPPGFSDDRGAPELADGLLPRLLDAADRVGLTVAVHIEPYKGRTPRTVINDVKYLQSAYGTHKALCRRNGMPVVYLYDSYLSTEKEWADVLWDRSVSPPVRQSHAFIIGLAVEKQHLGAVQRGGFHGIYTYFVAKGFSYGSDPKHWDSICDFCHEHDMDFVPSVGPGYDDSRVRPWNGRNTHLRIEGVYYREYMNAAHACHKKAVKIGRSSVVSITSYNEWHEGTQIEPSVDKQGYLSQTPADPEAYLKITKEYVNLFG